MSTLLQSTREALGGDALPQCTSRALRLTRYAQPELSEKTQPTRQSFLRAVVASKDQRAEVGLQSWQAWLNTITPASPIIYAELEVRLLINMGGTVLENAGLQLDRFGTAFVPGSAVKACARRTALAALREWTESGTKPCDMLAPVCALFSTPAELLLAVIRVFGCTDLEWGGYDPTSKSSEKNDLAWALGDDLLGDRNLWAASRETARATLCKEAGNPDETKPTRRGAVAFLPAYPYSRPQVDLELDVLTGHHSKYYSAELGVATDNENPIPVFFPAVAAGAVYSFAVLTVGKSSAEILGYARTWLSVGLTVFGLGAKTAAGYGYFKDVTQDIAAKQAKIAEEKRAAEEAAAAKRKEEADRAARKAREAARAAMTPQQRADDDLAVRAADWSWMKQHLTKFSQHPPEAQAALLRWFNGAGKERWLAEIKPDAAKGKKPWSQIIGAIHAAKKTHKIDLP